MIAQKIDIYRQFNKLGHVKSPGETVVFKRMIPREAISEEYTFLPSFMVQNPTKNATKMASEKSLRTVNSQNLTFLKAPSYFKKFSVAQVSKMTHKLKETVRKRNLALAH